MIEFNGLHVYLIIDPKIVQPSNNSHAITFDESSSSVQLMCSLNVIIPSNVTVIWTHNGNLPPLSSRVIQTGNNTTLLIENPQSSDACLYRCIFRELNLQRIITLG